MRYFIGVDIGGTTIKFGLFTEEMHLLEKWRIPTRTLEEGKHILPDTAASVRGKLDALEISFDALAGVGIGIPGPVVRMHYAYGAVNLHWGETDVSTIMQPLLGNKPVFVANDANLAALAEASFGAGRGYRSINMVVLGTGVGSGIILDGRILEGAHGFGGEYGLATFGKLGRTGSGDFSCVEDFASGTGLVRVARELLVEGAASMLSNTSELSAQQVFEAAKAGDVVASNAVEVLGRNLGGMLSLVSRVIDPEAFIFGGGVANAGELLIEVVKKHYSFVPSIKKFDPEFLFATLGNDAGIYGAAKLALDMVE